MIIRDPRVLSAIKRLKSARVVYFVMSIKGGVGKTTVSVLLALGFTQLRGRTGLLDLDFVNPSTHVLLGLKPGDISYSEHYGLVPFKVGNLLYFTIAPFTRELVLPLRGKAAQNLLWEVLSVVSWNSLEVLIVDTPPGLGDEHLEVLYKLKDVIKPIVVTTPSKLAATSVEHFVKVLRDIGYHRVYLLENMGEGLLKPLAEELGARYVGNIPWIRELESCTGSYSCLCELSKQFAKNIIEELERSST